LAADENKAAGTGTGGKENVSTSIPPAVMPENRAGKQHSDPDAMQKEAKRHSDEIRRDEDKRGQP
jgi:hypothetical protein